jgi:chromosome segregation ATPase
MNPIDLAACKGKKSPKKSPRSKWPPTSVKKRKRHPTAGGEEKKQRKLTDPISPHKVKMSNKISVRAQDKSAINKATEQNTSKYFTQKNETEKQNSLQTSIDSILKRLENISLNEEKTRKEITSMVQKVDSNLESLQQKVDSKLESIQQNIVNTGKRLESMEQKVINTEAKIGSTEQKIDLTMKTIDDFKQSLEYTQGDVHNLNADMKGVKAKVTVMEACHIKLSQTDQALAQRLDQIEQENKEIKSNLDDQENYSRRENIICEGVPESLHEAPFHTAHRIFQTLRMQTPAIQRCHRLGTSSNLRKRPRPFIIRLAH